MRGEVSHRDGDRVVVDVRGIGYLVHVAAGSDTPSAGQQVELFTSLQVREDSMTLYGFKDRDALATFELLLTSSGVGPRLALASLATLAPSQLRTAIATGDVKTLTGIPGVGRKVAERLVLELKDKIGAVVGVEERATSAEPAHNRLHDDVRDALAGLGYSSAEIARALAEVLDGRSEQPADVSEMLRVALQHLGSVSASRGR